MSTSSLRKFYFIFQLFYFIGIILLVMLCFRWISPKEKASLFAGFLFVFAPLLSLCVRKFKNIPTNQLFLILVGQFVFLFAVPTFIIRAVTYPQDWKQISWLGLGGPEWHRYSTYSFMLMMIGALILDLRSFAKLRKEQG